MTSKTMGRRYSKALFALALEKGESLDELQREIQTFADTLTEDHRLLQVLSNPKAGIEERGAVLDKVLAAIGARPIIEHLARLLLRKGRLQAAPDIASEFQRKVDEHSGVVRASVASSRELSEEEQGTIREILHRRFNKKIVLSQSVDADLIGGVIIRVGSLCFDGSIRSQLKDIRSQLLEEVPYS